MSCSCIARCKACNAQILWVPSEKGVPMPVDCEPTPDGNIRLSDKKAMVMTSEEMKTFRGPRHTSHFATCPSADMFRRGYGR